MRALFALMLVCGAARAERLEATLYHYNLQYVAGGMSGFPDGKTFGGEYDLSETEVEDLILVESFQPVLDVYDRHPTWKIDLEMQGLMVEVMAARHPAILAQLRRLAVRRQVEIVSFHYSDQLFLAYPRRDMARSLALNRAVFQKHALPLSSVVFTQEGQFNEGLLAFMRGNGLSIAVLPKNLLGYMQGEGGSPFYRGFGVDVVVGGGGGTFADLEVGWSGPCDGEVVLTHGGNPYLGRLNFRAVPAEIESFEDERVAREAQGTRFVTVSELVARARPRGTFPALPPISDGTWQPNSTRNLFRWMGGMGGLWDLFAVTENDNRVLTTVARASLSVEACEIVARFGQGRPGAARRQAALETAVRELLLAQVSDSTGWNPWLAEVRYSLDHAAAAEAAARACIDDEELRGPGKRRVDLAARTVIDDPAPAAAPGALIEAPITISVEAPGREVKSAWRRVSPGVAELIVDFGAAPAGQRLLSLTFPMEFERVVYVPALDEERLVDLPASAFLAVEHTLPLPTGLVGLGPGRFLVKSVRDVHLAALVRPAERTVRFTDETVHADETQSWRFLLVEGDGPRAMAVARALNLEPALDFDLTAQPSEGCGCGSGAEPAGWALLLAFFHRAGKRTRKRLPNGTRRSTVI